MNLPRFTALFYLTTTIIKLSRKAVNYFASDNKLNMVMQALFQHRVILSYQWSFGQSSQYNKYKTGSEEQSHSNFDKSNSTIFSQGARCNHQIKIKPMTNQHHGTHYFQEIVCLFESLVIKTKNGKIKFSKILRKNTHAYWPLLSLST